MEQENLKSLKTSLEIRGFDPRIFAELEQQMKDGKPEFVLRYAESSGDKQVVCQLQFKKHEEYDHYYFNRYQATLLIGGELHAQTSVKASWKIRVQEITNIMEYGQNVAVYKQNIKSYDGHLYNAYITLDPEGKRDEQGNILLNTYHDNYYAKRPFDIKEQLENPQIPFRTKQDYDSIDALIRDIHQAIPVEIVMNRNGKEEDGFLNVNARRGMLNFMDVNGFSIDLPNPGQQQEQKEQQNESVKKKPWINQGPQKKAWKPNQSKGISR